METFNCKSHRGTHTRILSPHSAVHNLPGNLPRLRPPRSTGTRCVGRGCVSSHGPAVPTQAWKAPPHPHHHHRKQAGFLPQHAALISRGGGGICWGWGGGGGGRGGRECVQCCLGPSEPGRSTLQPSPPLLPMPSSTLGLGQSSGQASSSHN